MYRLSEHSLAVETGRRRRTHTHTHTHSEHSLAVETGRRRQTWLSREDRLCLHCMLGVTETELHFLTECTKYTHVRDHYYPKINLIFPQFNTCNPTQKLSFILGEEAKCALIAATFLSSCHLLRDSQRETHTHTHTHTHSQPKHTHIRPTQTANKHTQPKHTHTQPKHTH